MAKTERKKIDKVLFAIVLAAGESKRFGSTKQLAKYNDQALVTNAVRISERVCNERSILVTGHDWKKVTHQCGPLKGFFVLNSNFRAGIATSICAGIESIPAVADAALILLADQPLITIEHLNKLKSVWLECPTTIVPTSYANTTGPPTIFPRSYFSRLATLEGDHGAKEVINNPNNRVELINFEKAAIDIDRLEDLEPL